MMKKALVVMAVMAVASVAMAAPSLSVLAGNGADTATEGRAITPDGKWIVGLSGASTGVLWNAASPGTATWVLSSDGAGASVSTGVGYRNGTSELVIHGLSAGWNTNWFYNTAAGTFGVKRRDTNVGSAPQIGTSNTLRSTGADDTWFDAWFDTTNGNPLNVEKGSGAAPGSVVRDQKATTTRSALFSMSNTGLAVGRRRDAANVYQNYAVQWNGLGSGAASYFTGLNGTTAGEAWAVSGDGKYAFGYSPKPAATGNYPYMRDMTTGTVTELPGLGGAATAATYGIPYGASDDGRYVVGLDYTFGTERAVLWDTQAMTALDLTQFATDNGILGEFTGNLRRGYSVGVDAAGNPVVTGRGFAPNVSSGWTGFVLTIPEPTTVLFLALGGLALIRRR